METITLNRIGPLVEQLRAALPTGTTLAIELGRPDVDEVKIRLPPGPIKIDQVSMPACAVLIPAPGETVMLSPRGGSVAFSPRRNSR